MAALRERYPARRVWALFEPRSNTSRRAVFQDAYAEALALADEVVLAQVFRKQTDVVDASEELSTERLVADLGGAGRRARVAADSAAIAELVGAEARSDDVVVMMSNGSFGGLRSLLVDRLSQR